MQKCPPKKVFSQVESVLNPTLLYYTIFILLFSSFSLNTCALKEIRSLWSRGWLPEGNFRFNLGLAEFLCTDAIVTGCQANIVAVCASEEVADISFRAGICCHCWSMLTWTPALIGTLNQTWHAQADCDGSRAHLVDPQPMRMM